MILFLKIVALFITYYFSAHMGLKIDAVSGFATLVWPPSGIALASLLLFGPRLWPGIFLGAFAINLFHGANFLTAIGIGVGNTSEALVATHLLTKWQDFHRSIDRFKDVLILLILGCAFSSIFSATIGLISLWSFGQLNESAFITWQAWWAGDALGMLIITPLILCWGTLKVEKIRWGKVVEGVILIGCLLLTGFFIFSQKDILIFWFFPFIIWAALSLGQVGNVTVVFLISVMAIWGTAHDFGPFSKSNLRDNLFLLNWFMLVITSAGMILAAVFTERKKALEALEYAIQTRDEFLSIASHELKTPLTSLSLQLQLVRFKGNSPESLERALDLSMKQVRRIGDLIDNLLNVSLMRTGRFSYKFEDTDLSDVISSMVKRYDTEMEKANCLFYCDIQENIRGILDSLRIEQVIDNLLSNAVKYAPGSAVRVSLTKVENTAILIVEDQGPGIPEDKQQLVFERYGRVSETSSTSGLGLGLFVVKEIIESHKGTIFLTNKPAGGAKFTFNLPI